MGKRTPERQVDSYTGQAFERGSQSRPRELSRGKRVASRSFWRLPAAGLPTYGFSSFESVVPVRTASRKADPFFIGAVGKGLCASPRTSSHLLFFWLLFFFRTARQKPRDGDEGVVDRVSSL